MTLKFTPPADLSPYQGYIFDCDGTLADTMLPHFWAWRAALRAAGAGFEFTWDLFQSRAGMSMRQTVAELEEQFTIELDVDSTLERQLGFYESLESEVQPIEAVVAFARRVARTAPVAVASGSPRASVDRTLKRIGASDLFPFVVTPEDVAEGKPHPDMFLLAAKLLGVEASACLVLEDGELGFEAARRAGMDYAIVKSSPPDLRTEPRLE